MTKITIVSDAPSDVGKTFAGQKIITAKEYKRRRRSKGSRRAPKPTPTKVYVVSDAPSDVGRTFAGATILSPSQFKEIQSKSKGVIVKARVPTQQEKAKIQQQIAKEKAIELGKIRLAKAGQFKTKKEESRTALQQLQKINLTSKDQNITNKILTGQTITPQENIRYNQILKENQSEIDAKQLKLLKRAPKDVATGLYEVGKELVLLPVQAVRGSYNYGKSLRSRFEKGENNPLTNDIVKLGKGTVSVAKFVKNNPKESASIVGMYAAVVGKNLEKDFIKNPVKTTTKAAAYLFPGTVLKGGAAVVKVGAKGVTSVVQAKRLTSLNKVINVAKQGSLTTAQSNKLNRAVVGASKIGNKAKRENKVKNALKGILKDRGIKAKRGANVQQLSNQVKASKVQKVKLITKKLKKVIKKPIKEKPITLAQLRKSKLEVGTVTKLVKTKKGRKTITRYKVTKKGALKKITKKEFDRIKAKKKKTLKKVVKKKVVPKKVKKIDVTKLEAKTLKKALKEKGIVKKGKTTYIDINAVKRLEKADVPVKVVPKNRWGKKGQVRFSNQVQVQVQQQTKAVNKAKKLVKNLKKGKKTPKKKLVKAKNQLRNLKKKLTKLKNFVKANRGVIIRAALIIKIIDTNIKDVSAVIKALDVVPIKEPARKPRLKPVTEIITKPIKKPIKAITPAQKVTPKKVPVTKQIITKPIKKPRPVKKPPVKPPKKKKLPKVKLAKRKKKITKKGAIIYTPTGKKKAVTIKTGLPINRARKVAKLGLDNSILGSVSVKPYGKTKKKDIKDTISQKNRRKRSKKAKVQKIVEKRKHRLDTPGEKKGIKFGAAVKSAIKKEKAKLKKTPKKAKKTIKKKVAPKKTKKVKKVSKKSLKKAIKKKVIKKAVKKKAKKVVKKKISKATKKKIIKKLKKVIKKKKIKKIVKKKKR